MEIGFLSSAELLNVQHVQYVLKEWHYHLYSFLFHLCKGEGAVKPNIKSNVRKAIFWEH